jgi:hypothetical protein
VSDKPITEAEAEAAVRTLALWCMQAQRPGLYPPTLYIENRAPPFELFMSFDPRMSDALRAAYEAAPAIEIEKVKDRGGPLRAPRKGS